jgi:hypothetical protein
LKKPNVFKAYWKPPPLPGEIIQLLAIFSLRFWKLILDRSLVVPSKSDRKNKPAGDRPKARRRGIVARALLFVSHRNFSVRG